MVIVCIDMVEIEYLKELIVCHAYGFVQKQNPCFSYCRPFVIAANSAIVIVFGGDFLGTY
jgi:hypothetical protein